MPSKRDYRVAFKAANIAKRQLRQHCAAAIAKRNLELSKARAQAIIAVSEAHRLRTDLSYAQSRVAELEAAARAAIEPLRKAMLHPRTDPEK